jgi:hypothetical protein
MSNCQPRSLELLLSDAHDIAERMTALRELRRQVLEAETQLLAEQNRERRSIHRLAYAA